MDEKVEQILLEMRENEHISEAFEDYGKKKNLEIWEIIDSEMDPIIKRQLSIKETKTLGVMSAINNPTSNAQSLRQQIKKVFCLYLNQRDIPITEWSAQSLRALVINHPDLWNNFISQIIHN